jgi:hypothetical protein
LKDFNLCAAANAEDTRGGVAKDGYLKKARASPDGEGNA